MRFSRHSSNVRRGIQQLLTAPIVSFIFKEYFFLTLCLASQNRWAVLPKLTYVVVFSVFTGHVFENHLQHTCKKKNHT